ncbi:hypothetical protein DERF_002574 [Dermatophagoides farinae]|uniref:Uncharacterized protein n=1 Tax=Dermatophagoides farinae TaxID=6954 RepID=A0A922IAX8_DERFA|nr:hypothetical protein DERF_002574 [Dermatophagoides farinae]
MYRHLYSVHIDLNDSLTANGDGTKMNKMKISNQIRRTIIIREPKEKRFIQAFIINTDKYCPLCH